MGGFIGLCQARCREWSNLLRFCGFAGERTFGVLTKLDLMDKGTNALDVSAFSLILLINYGIVTHMTGWIVK